MIKQFIKGVHFVDLIRCSTISATNDRSIEKWERNASIRGRICIPRNCHLFETSEQLNDSALINNSLEEKMFSSFIDVGGDRLSPIDRSRHSSYINTLHIFPFSSLHNIIHRLKVRYSLHSILSIPDVCELGRHRWFQSLFHHCTVPQWWNSDRNQPLRGWDSLPSSFICWGKALFFDWNRKNSAFSSQMNSPSETPSMRLLGGCNPTQRNSACWNTNWSVKVFFAIHVGGHGLAALPESTVPSYSQQEQSFSVRARHYLLHFSILFILYSAEKKQNTHYNFLFTLARLFLIVFRLGWPHGNDCCAISTARS